MGKSKDGNVTCFMYTQMRIVGLALAERSARKNLRWAWALMCRHCDARKALLERLRGPIFLMSKPPISGYEPHKVQRADKELKAPPALLRDRQAAA